MAGVIIQRAGAIVSFTHPAKPGRVTIVGKPGEDMHSKTLAGVFRQAKIEKPKR